MINNPNNFKTHVRNRRDINILNVIRKKEFINPQQNWWKPGKIEDTYYSNILEDRHYLYAFTQQTSAERCLEFLKYYRLKNNSYPSLYGNSDSTLYPGQREDIYIDIESLYSLKERCLVNNIGLLAIHEFDYTFLDYYLGKRNVFDLSFSAVDLLEDEVIEYDKQIEHFNYLAEL